MPSWFLFLVEWSPFLPHYFPRASDTVVMNTPKNGGRRRCACCGRYFCVDPRVGGRQICCGRASCQRWRKRRQEEAWLRRNPDNFRGRYVKTKAWREVHPGYQRQWRALRRGEIQTQIRHGEPAKSAFVDLGIRILSRNGEIQTQIPYGMRVVRASAGYGVASFASGG